MKHSAFPFLIIFIFLIPYNEFNCISQALILTPEHAVELAYKGNPQVKNSELKIKQAAASKESSIDLSPLYFSYYYGPVNSSLSYKYWTISQSLGSIPSYFINSDLARKKHELSQSELEVNKRDLQMKVHSTYYSWIYKISRRMVQNEEMELIDDFLKAVQNQYEHGEAGEQILSLAMSRHAEIENNLMNADDEVYLAENALKQLILVDDSIIPSVTELEMIAILPSTDSLKRFSADAQLKQYIQMVEIRRTELKLEKWKFFPELNAGYFNQEIPGLTGFHGWQAGLSFPLWFLPRNAAVRRARIEKEIAENDLKSMQFILDKTIDRLLTELNKSFRQIYFAEKYQLKQAEQAIQNSQLKFHKEEIGYSEYLTALTEAIKIKMNYLETLETYNQTAIRLEYFISNP